MYDDNFLANLLECLENAEVAEKITAIVNNTSVSVKPIASIELAQGDDNFKQKLESIEKDYNFLQLNYKNLTKELIENKELLEKTTENEKNLKKELEEITEVLVIERERQSMFEVYKNLAMSTKSDLSAVFKQETFENFIACGCQRSNIDTIWEFTKNLILSEKMDELTELNQILQYFIQQYNNISQNPTLAIRKVNIGDEFDTSVHIKSADSKSSGKVTAIYLLGYENTINQKIINKTIVRVE